MTRSIRLRGHHLLLTIEAMADGRRRLNLKVRDPRRPLTISLNLARYAPDRRRSF